MINIFIFRRDLRTFDNTALNKLKTSFPNIKILPIFIFNKKQIDKDINHYYSSNAVQFLFECLDELPFMNYFYTDNDLYILNDIKKRFQINAIAFNIDYTPFAIKRDKEIKEWCILNNINLIIDEDYTLFKIGNTLKDDNKPYIKFTPYYNKTIKKKPSSINTNNSFVFMKDDNSKSLHDKEISKLRPKTNIDIKIRGGRKNALEILNKLKNNVFAKYDNERDYPYLDKTTKLSPYIKFGVISIREIYYILPVNHGIIRELVWRDFYANISFYFPYIYGNSFLHKYNNIKWDNNELLFKKWTLGMTGFPMVDAAMRQLNKSGWLHNRCRMIVASFLTKNLFIDWRKGEHYFATKLVDYDPSSNNGGWQWSASTGSDSQPYFRIFSPSAQLKKFDKDCLYVKLWIEELRNVDNKIILNWEKNNNYNINYPKPIIDFKETSKRFIYWFNLS
jgi:deoxyribodipyrimidine photo-lyase